MNNMTMNKEKILAILKSLKERYNITSEQWATLLGVSLDTYKNALYKKTLSGDNMFLIVAKLDALVQAGVVEFTKEELEVLR